MPYQKRYAKRGKTTANRYAGDCVHCGQRIEARAGVVEADGRGNWILQHMPERWVGSPASGRWIGGCPKGE